MRKLFLVSTVLCVLLLQSCATIVSGSRQKVNFSSEPSGATVYINEVEVGKTPLEENLKRNQEYNIILKLDGYQPYETTLSKKFNAWYIGNVLFGGIIGLIVDPITGAMFKLSPDEVNAQMQSGTTFNSKGKDIYIAVSLDIDPNWEKVGQLEKVE